MNISRIGIWSSGLRFGDPARSDEAAAELEGLGFGTLWMPGAMNPGTLDDCGRLLRATTSCVLATGIVNIWVEDAREVAATHARLSGAFPGRLMTGLGISHKVIDRVIDRSYTKPFSEMQSYLDLMDGNEPPVPKDERILAAIGPRMLALAAERASGTHPYLMPPEHTAIAREAVGPDAHVAPEVTVILETDPARAREAGREFLQPYIGLPNYMGRLRELLGLEDADFLDGGSDRLVDATVCWGDEAAVRARVDEHHAAGADHVCVQLIGPSAGYDDLPLEGWRRLAPALRS